jgi:transposase-like protein
VFDAEDEKGVFSRVQTRGGSSAGEQRSTADAGGERGGDFAVDVAELAGCGSRWDGTGRSRATTSMVSPLPSPADQASEITRLKRELDRTRMERDVLKKAIGIFAEVPR